MVKRGRNTFDLSAGPAKIKTHPGDCCPGCNRDPKPATSFLCCHRELETGTPEMTPKPTQYSGIFNPD